MSHHGIIVVTILKCLCHVSYVPFFKNMSVIRLANS